MDKTANGHNMLWIDGDEVGLRIIDIIKDMYKDRLVYPVKNMTPLAIPEYYYVIFSIDGEEFSISCEFGDYIIAAESDKGDLFLEEIDKRIQSLYYKRRI